ncbi:transcription factor Dp-1 [Nematocida sp. LUAm3]|nr:transcription factor Dp-1 [Nematocida sp. LUAm3]KAI5175562.1 transcription factor Dp-1 [Nematocida sp. LUAm2]KAI5178408.1 transcription factor Dp-1 [Nematocida sp. LUAm1]
MPNKERRGLKAFSGIIMSILQKQKSMDYSKVAETVIAIICPNTDDKNIRRRVYDALNVMCAADVIRKEKKTIYITNNNICSCGEPSQEISSITDAGSLSAIQLRIEEKRNALQETKKRKSLLLSLIETNKRREKGPVQDKIEFPFILISTYRNTRVDCETNDKRSYFKFIFGGKYRIYEDVQILAHLFKHPKDASLLAFTPQSDQNTSHNTTLQPTENAQNDTENVQNTENVPPHAPHAPVKISQEEEEWLDLYNFLT